MGRPAICVEEDDGIDIVIAKITTHNIIVRIPVAADGKLGGLISRADVLSLMIEPEFVTVFGGK